MNHAMNLNSLNLKHCALLNLQLIISAMRAWIALDPAKQFKIVGPASRLKQWTGDD
jgi:hypothetical protein